MMLVLNGNFLSLLPIYNFICTSVNLLEMFTDFQQIELLNIHKFIKNLINK